MFQFSMMDHVMIWKFSDAPDVFRKLSDFESGKEMWLAFIPSLYQEDQPWWMPALPGQQVHKFLYGKYGAKVYIAASA